MDAKEFFGQNKGKYFIYSDEKCELVGYSIIKNKAIIKHKNGWKNDVIFYGDFIDENLASKDDIVALVCIDGLKPFYGSLNLCEILNGCEGRTVYSLIIGYCRIEYVGTEAICISSLKTNYNSSIFKDGKLFESEDGECTLFPSKENRDWSKFLNK